MARIEPVYRRDHQGTFPATSGGLADPVPRLSKRDRVRVSGLHRPTMRTETPNGQHGNQRTRSPRTGDHNSHRGRWAGRFKVSGSPHDPKGQLVSAFADIVVSAFIDFPGQHLLTLSRKDIQNSDSLFFGTAEPLSECPIQNRTAKRLTAAVRNRREETPVQRFRFTRHTEAEPVKTETFFDATERFCKRVN